MSLNRFVGQVAVITGAASGIGQACALRFAREGANVACLDFNATANQATAAECRETGAEVSAHTCDVTDAGSLKAAIAAIMAQWGRVDILVAAAGIYSGSPLPEVSLKQWQRLIDDALAGERGKNFLGRREALLDAPAAAD